MEQVKGVGYQLVCFHQQHDGNQFPSVWHVCEKLDLQLCEEHFSCYNINLSEVHVH